MAIYSKTDTFYFQKHIDLLLAEQYQYNKKTRMKRISNYEKCITKIYVLIGSNVKYARSLKFTEEFMEQLLLLKKLDTSK